jgi:putative transposase
VIDPVGLQFVLSVLTGWLDRRERAAVAYLIEENRFLRRQLSGRRLRLTDDDRRRLAARANRVGRATLREIATLATPFLKAAGLAPVPQRPTSWQTFLNAHWGAIAGADFFTTEVWTWRGLVTYYTVFVIDLASRRVRILGSTPHPEALFMQQIVRTLTMAEDGVHVPHVLICDRDRKWSGDVRCQLRDAGIRVVFTPERAPNANAYAERFVRSIKEECLDRIVPIGERHFRRAVAEYVEHYHGERNH